MPSIPVSNKTRIAEITAVICTAAGKFIFMDYLNWRFAFITTAILGWTIYIFYRSKKTPGILSYWGFRADNFKSVLKKVLPFGLATVIACVGIGIFRQTIHLTWHIIPILVLYPVWGIIQQFLLIAQTAGNLHDRNGNKWSNAVIILLAAVLFAIVHYPFIWLIIGTFVLALFYGWVYLKERNIYVLGIFHGWLGGIFFYTVVDRDPFLETFGKLLHLDK